MAVHKRVRDLVEAANAEVACLSAEKAIALQARDDVTIVDLRDIRERIREGFVPDSLHAPRGMLEFWVDPESPYHRDVFANREFFTAFATSWDPALVVFAVRYCGRRVVHFARTVRALATSSTRRPRATVVFDTVSRLSLCDFLNPVLSGPGEQSAV